MSSPQTRVGRRQTGERLGGFIYDQLEKYQPPVPEPKDFEEFWKATLDDAAGWPVLLGAAL